MSVSYQSFHDVRAIVSPSPMVLSDRLLSLAEDADRAGCRVTAEHLLALAHSVFDESVSFRQ